MRRGLAGMVVCAALPACLDAPPSSSDDARAISSDAPILEAGCGDPVFEDRFGTDALDAATWTPEEEGVGTDVSVSQGVLHVEANPAGAGYAFASVEGTTPIPLADHVAYVTTSVTFVGSGHAFFGWLVDPTDDSEPVYLGIQATGADEGNVIGVLQQGRDTDLEVAFCGDDPCPPYDVAMQRVWKIVTTADTLSFYTSSDTIEWTTIFEGYPLPGTAGTLALWSDCESGGTRAFIEEVRVFDCS